MSHYRDRIRPYVDAELLAAREAEARQEFGASFGHLERAQVLGQASTVEHVRVHWRMLRWAARRRNLDECVGQLVRILGAATKTPFGLAPQGNTGGTNVSPFPRMPVPPDLAERINGAQRH
jgi:Protein of unknown function (DUF3703)